MFKLTRKIFYIILFSILWLITAFSSFFHAIEFFELSNVTWMAIILALAFEIGQASVLMSILTSQNDRKKYTPWILMCILTLVQIIGNVYSSYKYIMLNSPENLKYFKEPIFIWTQLPDAEATVIITYVSAAILPIVALLMTSMITNYLSDEEELSQENTIKETEIGNIDNEIGSKEPIILNSKEDFDKVYNNDETNDETNNEINNETNDENEESNENDIDINNKSIEQLLETENKENINDELDKEENKEENNKRESHFINLK